METRRKSRGRRIARASLGLGLVMGVVLGSSSEARATNSLELTLIGGSTTPQPGGGSDTDSIFEQQGELVGLFLSAADSASSTGGSTMASASVGYGWSRGFASASHSDTPNGISSSSGSTANSVFRDDLIITAPDLSGSGSVIFRIDVSGTLAVNSIDQSLTNADSGWQVFTGSVLGSGFLFYGALNPEGDRGLLMTGDQTGGSYEYPLTFNFGSSFPILVSFSTDADVDFCCSAASDFDSTLTWGGVVELRDSAGALVPAFTITSASGADYSQPIAVPEPSATALAGAALVTLVALRKFRTGPSPH